MTRGIFNPDGPEIERNGSQSTVPDAEQISHLLPPGGDGMEAPEAAAPVDDVPDAPTRESTARNLEQVESEPANESVDSSDDAG